MWLWTEFRDKCYYRFTAQHNEEGGAITLDAISILYEWLYFVRYRFLSTPMGPSVKTHTTHI